MMPTGTITISSFRHFSLCMTRLVLCAFMTGNNRRGLTATPSARSETEFLTALLGYIKREDIFVETGRGLTHKSNLLANRVFVIDIFIC